MTPEQSHAPSTSLGACDPCRAGDHAGCWTMGYSPETPYGCQTGHPDDDCTCYDDRWEWHEQLGRNRSFGGDTRVDLGGGMVVPLAELLEDE